MPEPRSMNFFKNFRNTFARKHARRLSFRPRVEALEERWCPAGTWEWDGAGPGISWSNPAGGNWIHDGIVAPANNYPGMVGSQSDVVKFDIATAGICNLDVGLANPIQTLQMIWGWNNTLT